MSEQPLLLWLDLETTGLGDDCHVLEVFAEVTDWDLTPQWSTHGISHVLWPMGEDVLAMHRASGLISDIAGAATRKAQSVAGAMDDVHSALALATGPMALAGSGVVFDQRIIARQWPDIAKWLTYWTIDLSPIRRLARGMGFGHLCLHEQPIPHRAEADVRRAQAEYRHWRNLFATITKENTK